MCVYGTDYEVVAVLKNYAMNLDVMYSSRHSFSLLLVGWD
jgi:hypothetical protein